MLTFAQLKRWAAEALDETYTAFTHGPGAVNFCNLQDAMLVYQILHRCELPAERMDQLLVKLASTLRLHWPTIIVREILECTLAEAAGRVA